MKIFNFFKSKCCKCKKSNREILSTKAENIINNKLDIICYMKYMLLLDVVYGKMKEDKKINFKVFKYANYIFSER